MLRMSRARLTSVFLTLAFLGGCSGSGTRAVTLEVLKPSTEGDATPVANAFVRAIPVAASPVPLPVNSVTLQEMGSLKNDADFTSSDGLVTLTISTIRPFLIEVAPAFNDTESHGEVWRANFDPETGALLPCRNTTDLQVRLVN